MKDATDVRGIRSRDKSGPLREKREDTHVGTIEQVYIAILESAMTCI